MKNCQGEVNGELTTGMRIAIHPHISPPECGPVQTEIGPSFFAEPIYSLVLRPKPLETPAGFVAFVPNNFLPHDPRGLGDPRRGVEDLVSTMLHFVSVKQVPARFGHSVKFIE
ncbi:hypothetical protein MPTK1_1g20360 [Marchantia polymorpha subsp. ruderalis]|uniref:Uncharacterized protein n=2 Tax=Marchantia polymorpha TaxID=3197 RepID=A0AAF6AS92_MARPO|nr:hypothetical protein MARPO_0001s0373 [Marchantia polymorpha]BBM99312.1 hypothetical protein Mp_1g20360 [Marchantia polymorpha subsp. ruderalis]|eukprot:PTQ50394.1 hypothetical protein MARPO_0001s0373 [Marchantia polymorpha]